MLARSLVAWIVTIALLPIPSAASDVPFDLTSPSQVFASVDVPEVESVPTALENDVSTAELSGQVQVTIEPEIDVPVTNAQRSTPVASEIYAPLTVALPEGLSLRGSDSEDFVVAANDAETFATYARATPDGGQVIFTATETEMADRFAIDLPSPIVETEQLPENHTAVVLANGMALVLYEAWAVDENSQPLTTWYEFDGSTVRQVVDVESRPELIVADPAWSYTYRSANLNASITTIRSAMNTPNRFATYFPVGNAPASMPRPNQFLPLVFGPFGVGANFNRYMNGQFSGSDSSERWWGFSFRAASGHVDGVGSSIRFFFSQSMGNGVTRLYVYGYVMNTNPMGLSQAAYKAGANSMWAQFAGRVSRYT